MERYRLRQGKLRPDDDGEWVKFCDAKQKLREVDALVEACAELGREVERLRGQCPRWTQQKPSEEGRYLRLNPPISHVMQVAVFIGLKPGVLVVPNPENPFNGTPVSELPDRFWWLGPIPSTERVLETVQAQQRQAILKERLDAVKEKAAESEREKS